MIDIDLEQLLLKVTFSFARRTATNSYYTIPHCSTSHGFYTITFWNKLILHPACVKQQGNNLSMYFLLFTSNHQQQVKGRI